MKELEVNLQLPDLWQQTAIRALQKGKDVVVDAPTGAGKTYIFEKFIESGLSSNAIYTVPTRALANDKWQEWKKKNWNVGITTGDISEKLDAPVVVATLETQKYRLISGIGPDLLVIDEYQMMGDLTRGINYELSMAMAPMETQLLLMSGSVGNASKVVKWLQSIGRDAVLIEHKERPVPLDEVHAAALPNRLPPSVKGFWPRLIGNALKAELGPILAFAPRRRAAEQMACQLASMLPEEDPLELTSEQKKLAGELHTRLLKSRIAFHHSGLDYSLRAGLIEPLAKAGQLRVVVATMGLSSGINFSMRTVVVTDREYRTADKHQIVRPDELLQMFGRAGRRGLDKRGFILAVPDKPRWLEARPAQLHRTAKLDWPSLIRVMQSAIDRDICHKQAAKKMVEKLFSKQEIELGLDNFIPVPSIDQSNKQTKKGSQKQIEILNYNEQWERKRAARKVPIECAWTYEGEKWIPALQLTHTLKEIGPGSICKFGSGKNFRYGKEIPIARIGDNEKDGELVLTKWIYARLRELIKSHKLQRRKWSIEKLEKEVIPRLSELTDGGRVIQIKEKANFIHARMDLGKSQVFAQIDSSNHALLKPKERTREVSWSFDFSESAKEQKQYLSPAQIWNQLGLIDNDTRPTLRGQLFSYFSHGEGLAISAALEDEDYDLEEIIEDLANLRAGHRFTEFEEYSGRLGSICRACYGTLTYEGYLNQGLPTDYGDGATEVIQQVEESPKKIHSITSEDFNRGDIDRIRNEWKSLLNQIINAPDLGWDRWLELKALARKKTESFPKNNIFGQFPELTHKQQKRHKSFLKF